MVLSPLLIHDESDALEKLGVSRFHEVNANRLKFQLYEMLLCVDSYFIGLITDEMKHNLISSDKIFLQLLFN